ncbi:solute carrier family 25 (mitochondrial folate transporter), member 32 [Fistulifera solaris]|uniref:Solute carrier family 25 (Mitochondrial folate transporter), member 32 n=1 Tax=Fistulifera solaris TaxID=1519565 RepID=A0A1Z5JKZ0_FISSO|nr:solute carrier family 25 (mitochondrial folate transporter), member 32 [Fistulifera solaris]|eukprot:GAX14431.1 solute carrier family 25 (mitochondrial folate transporter), member 32 [Fistulifera solaris]
MTTEQKNIVPLIAGFLGGSVSTTLLFPLDIIKVRLQVHESEGRSSRLGALRAAGLIYKYEGLGGFFAGWTPAVIGSAISWGGYFFFYEGFKKQLVQHRMGNSMTSRERASILTSFDNFALAVAAGGIMVAFTNPIWLMKTRMQLQMKRSSEMHNIQPYAGMRDAFRTIVREEGILALYRGSGPALLLTSHGGVQFVVYEYLKKHFHYQRARREDTSNVWERFELSLGYLCMGAVAKVAASTTTYPLQVIKARLQQRSQSLELMANGEIKAVRREYVGMLATGRHLWQREGFIGFFKGAIPNALRVAPGAAVTFVVYESVLDFLGGA